MAHSKREPAGRDIIPAFDTIGFDTVDTAYGPMFVLTSKTTGTCIHLAPASLPHLAAGMLSAWSEWDEPGEGDDGVE